MMPKHLYRVERWPRCNFIFFTRSAPDVPAVHRICKRRWGHIFLGTKHEGPMTYAPR